MRSLVPRPRLPRFKMKGPLNRPMASSASPEGSMLFDRSLAPRGGGSELSSKSSSKGAALSALRDSGQAEVRMRQGSKPTDGYAEVNLGQRTRYRPSENERRPCAY